MKIFCLTCREHILNTTDAFVMGSEYDGSMFVPAGRGKIWGNMFRQNDSVRRANLFCPRCEGQFIRNGKLLTEYGVIHPGQTAVDESFTIVAGDDHPLPGRIMFIKDSVWPKVDRVAEQFERNQAIMDAVLEDKFPQPTGAWPTREITEQEAQEEFPNVDRVHDPDTEFENIGPVPGPDIKNEVEYYVCRKCGKPYKPSAKHWFDKHVEECGK